MQLNEITGIGEVTGNIYYILGSNIFADLSANEAWKLSDSEIRLTRSLQQPTRHPKEDKNVVEVLRQIMYDFSVRSEQAYLRLH